MTSNIIVHNISCVSLNQFQLREEVFQWRFKTILVVISMSHYIMSLNSKWNTFGSKDKFYIHTSKHSLHRSSVFLKSIIWYYRGFLIFLPNYTLFYVFYKSKKKPLHHLLLIMLKEKHGTRLLCKFTLHVMLKTVLVTVTLWYIFSKQGTK